MTTQSQFRLVFLLALTAGCEGPTEGRFLTSAPPREEFTPVAYVLGARCGTLDCHGDPLRNMRVYGIQGLRWSSEDASGYRGTTDAEVDATYFSVVSIEPERMTDVMDARGTKASDWIVFSKGRGDQQHAGGSQLRVGSPADTCLLLWIAGRFGQAFEAACQEGAIVAPPTGDW